MAYSLAEELCTDGELYFNLDFTRALPAGFTFARSTTGWYENASGTLTSAAINAPRFDYNPVTLAPLGLLLEGARTNITTYSEQFDNAAWNKVNLTVSANAVVAPDGATTMDRLVETATTAQHAVIRNAADTITANTTYTQSVFLKAAERTTARLLFTNSGFANSFYNDFDISAGTVGSSGTVGSGTFTAAEIRNYGGSIYRAAITGKVDAASVAAQTTLYLNNGLSYLGDITKGLSAWGMQVEAGKFPSSYIPATATSVTRGADSLVCTGTDFSSRFGDGTKGTLRVTFDVIGTDAVQVVWGMGDNTGSNAVHLYLFNGTLFFVVTNSGSNVVAINLGTITPNVTYTAVCAWENNNAAAYLAGGGGVQVDTSCTIPTCNRMGVGRSDSGSNELFGHIKQMTFWRYRQPDQNLVNIALNPASFAATVKPSGGTYSSASAATTAMSDKTVYGSQAIYVYPASYTETAPIVLDAFTSLIGSGLWCTTHTFDQGAGASALNVQNNSCLDFFKSGHVKGGKFIAKNARYACHFQQVADGATQVIEDCYFEHQGNIAAGWDYQFACAAGCFDNAVQKIYRSVALSPYGGFSSHNKDGTHTTGCTMYYEGCSDISTFTSSSNKWGYRYEHICGTGAGSSGSFYTLHNCSTLNGYLYIIRSGSNRVANSSVALANPLTTTCAITGSNNNVSYAGNVTSTGAWFKETALAVKLNYAPTVATLAINAGTVGTDAKPLIFGTTTAYALGYGNNSFVHGSIDVSGQHATLDASSTLLGVRLGNCTGTNKSFKIDSTQIVLNQNYTAMTNAQVLSSIQGVIDTALGSNVATIYEYSVMDNYRPAVSVLTEDYTCGASESVVPGQLVTLSGGRLGVGWAYIAAGATGKVLTKGKVTQFTANSAARTALQAVGANTQLTVETV